jgi:hypothetical protein
MNEHLPPNCPMLKNDFQHYCPSPDIGPATYSNKGQCFKQKECTKIVQDFKKMKVPTTSELLKKFS